MHCSKVTSPSYFISDSARPEPSCYINRTTLLFIGCRNTVTNWSWCLVMIDSSHTRSLFLSLSLSPALSFPFFFSRSRSGRWLVVEVLAPRLHETGHETAAAWWMISTSTMGVASLAVKLLMTSCKERRRLSLMYVVEAGGMTQFEEQSSHARTHARTHQIVNADRKNPTNYWAVF